MLLSHLYKNTALFAVAAFIIMGVGLSSNQNANVPAEASAAADTITINYNSAVFPGNGTATPFKVAPSGSSILYGFSSLYIGESGTSMTMLSNNNSAKQGKLFNTTSLDKNYAKLLTITVVQTGTARSLTGCFGTTVEPTGNTSAKTAASTITWDVSASSYTYFKIYNPNTTLTKIANVTSITITFYPILSSIAVTTSPTKTIFDIGETYANTGMVVTATYEDTKTAAATGYTTDYDSHTFTSSDLGTQTVTISYTELGVTKTTTYSITVRYPALQSIRTSYTSAVGVDQFAINDEFESVPVYATWSSGSDSLVTSSTTFTIGGTTYTPGVTALSTAGAFTVTASYTDTNNSITKTTTYTIYVFALSSIAITAYPAKSVIGGTDFGLNETFSSSGLTITETFSYSGKTDITQIKTNGFSLSSPNMLTLGEQTVTVTFSAGGVTKTATYLIKVSNATVYSVTDQQQSDSFAAYVLAINTCGATNADVLEMVNEYGYMTIGAKEIFNTLTNRIGNDWSTGTGAKDRYDYLLYLHPNYFQGAANDGSAEALIENSILPAVLILSAIAMMAMSVKFIYSRKRKEN